MPLSDEDMYKMFGPTSCAPDEMQRCPKYYFVVAYCTPDDRHRCFGYFTTLKAAKNAIHNQWRAMEECYYNAFFIEAIQEGLFKIGEIVKYYEVDTQEHKLVEKERPKHLIDVCNWAIG